MNDSQFDDISRRIARVTSLRGSRRGLLKAGAVAGLATTIVAPDLCGAAPTAGQPARRPLGQQTSPDQLLIQQIAFDLDYDTERIFRFVADEIAYESYDGALRGVRGTIWSGAGNSVDQAQLLAALLTEALVDVRFAIGALAEADATVLVEAMSADRVTSETLASAREKHLAAEAPSIIPSVFDLPDSVSIPDPDDVLSALAPVRDELFAKGSESVSDTVDMLTGVLADAGVAIPMVQNAIADLERTSHVWVQIRQGSTWVDLDPSLGGSEAGSRPVTEPLESPAELPDHLFHTVTVRLIAESVNGEDTSEQTLLDYTARSQDLVGEDVMILHVEPESLEAIGAGLAEVLGGRISYYPVLIFGRDSYLADMMVTFGSSGGVLSDDVLGGGGGIEEGECLAERYEVEVASPGIAPVLATRVLFDRVPAAQRIAGKIVLADIPSVDEIELTANERGLIEMKTVVAFASVVCAVDDRYLVRPITDDQMISTYTRAVHGMYGTREALDRSHSEDVGVYLNRPNVAAYTTRWLPAVNGGIPTLTMAADLLHQSYGFRRPSPSSPAGIYAGVLAQQAERMALDPSLFKVLADFGALAIAPKLATDDIHAVFEAATRDGAAIVVITPDTAEQLLDTLDLPAAERARVAAPLAEGKVVVIPSKTVSLDGARTTAWWVFDPVTGELVDRLADGRGGASIVLSPFGDYALKLWVFTKSVKGIVLLGICVGGLAQAVGAMMNFGPNSSAGDLVGATGASLGGSMSCLAWGAAGAFGL